jgi:hypothetical protein
MNLRITALALILVLFLSVVVAAQDSPLPTEAAVPTVVPEPNPLPNPPAVDEVTLIALLTWLVFGGCGWVTFWLLHNHEPQWFKALAPKYKQYVASAFSGGLAVVAYLFLIALEVNSAPGDLVAWFDALVPVFMFGAGVAKLSHGQATLGSTRS